MNLAQLLLRLRADDRFLRHVTRWEVLDAEAGHFADWPDGLDPRLVDALRDRRIERLYSHQAASIEAALAGRSVVVPTPTASGKTLCYNVPVLDALLRDPEARALYLFPTKALSQDQMHEAHDLIEHLGAPSRFTPSTGTPRRPPAGPFVERSHRDHQPGHASSGYPAAPYPLGEAVREPALRGGRRGPPVPWRVRQPRGQRAASPAAHRGVLWGRPQFVCCSATIANPAELASQLCGHELVEIGENGAPRGEKHFIFYNPPVVNAELGIRRRRSRRRVALAGRFLATGVQMIVFARSRMRVELLLTYLEKAGRRVGIDRGEVRGYRGGYLPTERRAIERGLRDGSVRAVVSTNALELGIDIGRLDVCLMCGYAGSIASTWQQAGRAGRRNDLSVVSSWWGRRARPTSTSSVTRLLPGPFARARDDRSGQPRDPHEPSQVRRLRAALRRGRALRRPARGEILDYLAEQRVLHEAEGRYHWMADTYPAEEVSLRTARRTTW